MACIIDEYIINHGKKITFLPSNSHVIYKLQADADGNGTIDYDEFITATMHLNRMNKEEHLYTAFQYFDKDNSG